MTLGAIGSVLWGWIKGLPNWVWYAFLIIAAGYFIDKRGEARGRQREADKRDKEAAAVESEVISNINENTDEVIHDADAVREHPSASVLPDGTATLPPAHYRD
jgi:hypothetical protein